LAERIRLMRNFGKQSWDTVVSLGTNAKLNEISAAMGLTLLDELDRLLESYHACYLHYRAALCGLAGITLMADDPNGKSNHQYLVIEVDPNLAGLDSADLMQVLNAENVLARRYFYPACHAMLPYRELYPDVGNRLPNTERISRNTLCLPTGPAVSEIDIETIAQIIRLAIQHSARSTH
jgi:dTDP-4-amino-4,6-dideoxygalactose transaminase